MDRFEFWQGDRYLGKADSVNGFYQFWKTADQIFIFRENKNEKHCHCMHCSNRDN
jgi:hypothetical protein